MPEADKTIPINELFSEDDMVGLTAAIATGAAAEILDRQDILKELKPMLPAMVAGVGAALNFTDYTAPGRGLWNAGMSLLGKQLVDRLMPKTAPAARLPRPQPVTAREINTAEMEAARLRAQQQQPRPAIALPPGRPITATRVNQTAPRPAQSPQAHQSNGRPMPQPATRSWVTQPQIQNQAQQVAPRVSIAGVNPETEEQMLFSRI